MLERPTLPKLPLEREPPRAKRQSRPASLPYPKASTPFPNLLIDQAMPTLTDTEWRLLCLVCRQTLGYASADGAGRRARDWLTHRQLKARSGRASAAVSRAVDGLVRRNMIEVQSIDGEPLITPQERRRCQGALFFSLAPRLLRPGHGRGGSGPVENPVEN